MFGSANLNEETRQQHVWVRRPKCIDILSHKKLNVHLSFTNPTKHHSTPDSVCLSYLIRQHFGGRVLTSSGKAPSPSRSQRLLVSLLHLVASFRLPEPTSRSGFPVVPVHSDSGQGSTVGSIHSTAAAYPVRPPTSPSHGCSPWFPSRTVFAFR